MQTSAFFEHIEVCAFALSIETNAHRALTDMEIANENFGQPIRQMGIEQQQVGWGKGIESEHRLHDREYARCRPCLRPIRFRIERRERMRIVPSVTAEALG